MTVTFLLSVQNAMIESLSQSRQAERYDCEKFIWDLFLEQS